VSAELLGARVRHHLGGRDGRRGRRHRCGCRRGLAPPACLARRRPCRSAPRAWRAGCPSCSSSAHVPTLRSARRAPGGLSREVPRPWIRSISAGGRRCRRGRRRAAQDVRRLGAPPSATVLGGVEARPRAGSPPPALSSDPSRATGRPGPPATACGCRSQRGHLAEGAPARDDLVDREAAPPAAPRSRRAPPRLAEPTSITVASSTSLTAASMAVTAWAAYAEGSPPTRRSRRTPLAPPSGPAGRR
jgi:hypothetical protein